MNRIIRLIILLLLATTVVKANDFVFTPIDVSHGLSDNQVRYILQLHDGRMVFTTSGNLNLYDGAHFKYIHRTDAHIYPLKSYDGFYRVYQQGDSLLWIKDWHKIMCVNLRQEKYRSNLDSCFKTLGIHKPVEDLFIDAEQRIWTLNAGKLWRSDNAKELDITGNQGNLQDLAADKNNLYLFYNSGEVVCYDLHTGKKLYNKAAYPVNEQASFKNTSLVVKGAEGFYQLRNGSKGALFYFDTKKLTWEKILETGYSLNTLVVKEEVAYVSCTNGFWTINRATGKKEYLPVLKTVDGNTIDTEISTLFYDRQGGFWLGTLNQGLLYFHPSRYKLAYIGRSYFPAAIPRDLTVQAFAEDEKGNIYVKAGSQIYQYHTIAGNKSLTPITPVSLSKAVLDKLNQTSGASFGMETFTTVHTDKRGWKWAGTEDGLKLFKPGEPEKVFYTEQGLVNNSIHAILEDNKHRLWITTSNGISMVPADAESATIRFLNLNAYDGALKGEYANGAAFQSSDGTLYFGGINGFSVLHPDEVSAASLHLKPVFTGLFLKGTKIETAMQYDNNTILPQAPPYTQEIKLAHNQNFLTLEFSAINYVNPSQTVYRYRLEGIDANWRETYNNRFIEDDGLLRASYTNLPPGKYTFKVMALAVGQKEGEVSTLKITILAPWWKTNTAYILYVLAAIMMIAAFIWLYLRISRKRLERQHKEEILLLRIRNLIEQCRMLEEEKDTRAVTTTEEENSPETPPLNPADAAFLARAIELVEMNLEEPGYSVEALSRDLCMDRTGLYRKLIAVMDKSPSLFIRNIRLQTAARLILEGHLSIAAIAEKVGFSSASYFGRCFQEAYGCRPSEYAEKAKKSTSS